MSEDNIAVRLKFLIDNLGISSSQFADKCKIPRPTLSQLLTGRNKKISNVIIEQIHNAYPGLSVIWLMFGEGDMWSTPNMPNVGNAQPLNNGQQDDSFQVNSKSLPNNDVSTNENSRESSNDRLVRYPDTNTPENLLKNPHEDQEIRSTGETELAESKENGVNQAQNASVNSKNENVNGCFYNVDFLAQLSRNKEKQRKVVQVTIYFDDSTFQTFYPN